MNDALRLPMPFGPLPAVEPGAPIEHIVDLLRARARLEPDRPALRAVSRDDDDGDVLTCAGLDTRARAIAATLQGLCGGNAHGERGLLLLPTGLDYVAGFFGCLYAGAIAVPAFPPESARPQHLARVRTILQDARARFVLTDRAHRDAMVAFGDAMPELKDVAIVVLDEIEDAAAAAWRDTPVAPSDLAFLQYTSGSTSSPKGVMVSHANLMANEGAIVAGLGMTRDDTMVSWLPLYHDMGLIGGLLSPIYRGAQLVLMSPQYFLERPVRWLRAIDRFGGTVSGGPDFAYRLCAQRIDAPAIASLKLDSWRLAFSGSEPVRHDTLVDFCAAFAPAGFDPQALYPCYGLAEATLFVTGGQRGDGMRARGFERDALAQQTATPADDGAVLVGCGYPQAGHEVRLMTWSDSPDVAPQPVPAGGIGEIWVHGPSVAQGYWRNDEATARTFVQADGKRWLRTGDLGFVDGDQLHITGRCKDLIIVRGHNLYPQDLEQAVEADVELVRKGRVTAFAVDLDGEPGIGIAAEVGRGVQKMLPPQTLAEAIAVAVADACQQAASVVVLLNPGALPKTSSGKLQRSACAKGWRDGSLDAWATWQQGAIVGAGAADKGAPAADRGAGDPLRDAVASIWREVLQRNAVSDNDHFFLCGGSSLAAMQVLARAREQLHLDATPASLYENARLGDWVRHLATLAPQAADAIGATAIPAAKPIAVTAGAHVYRQSPAQQRLWFLHRLDAQGGGAYHVAGQLALSGRLDAGALQQALTTLVARHPALRTTFDERDGLAVQIVHAAAEPSWTERDLRDAGDATADADREARALVAQPFDLTRAPAIRAALLRLDDTQHRFVLVLHHIVTDAWSMGRLLDELAQAYAAHATGALPDAVTLPVTPADHAQWEHDRFDADALEAHLQWWQARLPEPSPVLALPVDRAREAARDGRGETLRLELPAGLTRDVVAFAAHSRATPFMVLAASFQWLLHRYAGETDIRIGVPVAQRDVAGLAQMQGCLVNTQVWRSVVDPRAGFEALVAQVRDGALAALAHRDAPFERVVERIAPQRSLSHSPLFQVMLNHHVTQVAAGQALAGWPAGITAQAQALTGGAQFDLALDIDEMHALSTGAGSDPLDQVALQARLTFPTALFDVATIARLGADWLAGLAALLAQPQTPLVALDAAFDSAAHTAGGTPSAGASSVPVHRLIDAQAQRQPSAPAVRDESSALTYGELVARANRVARWLLARGATPETRVALAMSRQVDMIVGLLGVLKAGCAYVPLDPSYPADRLTQILGDAGVTCVLTEAAQVGASWLPAEHGLVTEIATDRRWSTDTPDVPVNPQQLAYLIYTSGSTGTPKGVAVAHGPLSMHAQATAAQYRLTPEVCELHVLSISFDGAHERWMAPLLAGASLFVADERHWAPQTMLDTMRTHGVTNAGFPTAYLCRLATSGARGAPALRLLSFGGEAMPLPALRAAQALFRPAQTINGYGPTETVMTPVAWSIDGPVDAQDPALLQGQAYAPIGQPVGARRAWVLDAWLNEVPVGVTGELYLGGEGVARGYVGRPDLTAERFVPDPRGEPGARMYRTGDRVKRLADGTLVYLGRIDQQIKVRGFRIEPGEVEAQLLAERGVDDALAVAAAGPAGDQLVAYVAAHGLDGETLRTALAHRLPDYLVPAQVIVLATLPKLPNGKRDRSALPAPQWASTGGQAPQGAAEAALAALWRELLGQPSVGRDDNFFALGGDSIVALQLVSRARQAGWQLAPQDVFRHQTLARLAAVATLAGGDAVAQAPEPLTGDVPLTPVQAWFFAQAVPSRDHWNQWVEVSVPDDLDAQALRDALSAVVNHHDALRLRFVLDGAAWHAHYVAPEADGDLLWLASMVDEAMLEGCLAQAHRSLSLRDGPLVRALLARTDTGALRCFLLAHHAVVDGVSWRILLADLADAMAQVAAGREVLLPPTGQSMRAFAQGWHDWSTGEGASHALTAWQTVLRDASDALPFEATNAEAGVGTIELTLPDALTAALRHVERRAPQRFSIGDALTAAAAHTLGTAADAARYVVHVEGHGRDGQGDLSRTVGWFTAAWPLPVAVGATPAQTYAATRVAQRQLRDVVGDPAGYGALRYLGSPAMAATLAALPAGNVTVNYLGRLDAAAQGALAMVDGGLSADDAAPAVNALTLDVWTRDETLQLTCRYDQRRIARSDVLQWLADVERTLTDLAQALRDGVPATPADFAHVRLTDAQFAALPDAGRGLDAIVPATPMQQGLLFHAQRCGTADPYFYQKGFVIDGALDADAFAAAWHETVMRHAALRTSYGMEIGDTPLLLVHDAATVGDVLAFDDWRGEGEAAQHARLDARFAAERAAGFDLSRAHRPRLTLVRVAEQRWWLLWSSHHVALDGWSTGLVFSDVMQAYGRRIGAVADGDGVAQAPSFAAFAAWQATHDIGASLAHWRERLDGVTSATPLPAARAVGHSAGVGHDEASWRLEPAQWQQWCDAARRAGVTPGTLCQGAWALLLARHAGLSDVVFGVTASGRSAPVAGIEQMAGLFINTLPVRVRLDARADVAGWLRDVQAQAAQAREHEHVALGAITRAVSRAATAPDAALFESILVFENYPLDTALLGERADGLRLSLLSREAQARNNYPLSLVVEQHDGLSLVLAYARERYDAAAIQALGDRYVALLGRLAAALTTAASTLGTIGMADHDDTAQTVDGDAATAWSSTDLLTLWHAHVTQDGTALAAEGEDGTLDRAALDALATRVAQALEVHGAGVEDRVAVVLPRGVGLVAAILGAWKVGAAYVPLDPSQPAQRIAKLLCACGAKAVIAADDVPAAPAGVPIIRIDALMQAPASGDFVPREAHPQQAAYVIYTSGSTGEPKGVVVSRGALHNYVQAVSCRFGALAPTGGFAMASTVAADLGHTTLFGALALGRALYLVPHDCAFDAQRFADWCAARPIDALKIVPGHLRGLVEAAGDAVLPRKLLVTGGESLDPALVVRLRQLRPALTILNHYGPTEATVGALTHAVPDAVIDAPIPVGQPLANYRAQVLDADLNPAPAGVIGELYLGGAGLARGYLNAPGQTAERFIPDPSIAGQRLYRTGDRAMQRADGEIVYLGRIDDQVKIRGYRVEPGEVAQAMRDLSGVTAAAVVADVDAHGQARLIGVFVGEATTHAVRDALQASLPSAWVPAQLGRLDALPLTANGKLDRLAVVAALTAGTQAAGEQEAVELPHEGVESEIAAVWREVLKCEVVGRHEAFFEIGGDSILALQVIARLRKRGLKIGPQHLASHPSVAKLATVAGKTAPAKSIVPPAANDGVPAGDPQRKTFPLSSSQMRVWLETQLAPRAGAYHIAGALELAGTLDVIVLERALSSLAERHAALRTTVVVSDGEPQQQVHDVLRVALTQGVAANATAADIDARLAALTCAPFDLAAGPLWRVHLMTTGETSHVLMLVMHHLISDGWSMNLLIDDLAAAYRAYASGSAPPAQPGGQLRYGDYAVWQRAQQQGDAFARQLDWWKTRLGQGQPELTLPFDRPHPSTRDGAGDSVSLTVPPALPARIDAFARMHGATRFMVMAAAFQLLLHRVSGETDVRIGMPVANRTHEAFEPVVGFFVNSQVLRTQIDPAASFVALVGEVRQHLLDAQAHAEVPFERLVEHLAPVRSLSHHPLFQVSINHQKRAFAALRDMAGLQLTSIARRAQQAQVDLALDTEEDETGDMRAWLTFACDVFDAATVRRLGEQWLALLATALAAPQTPVGRLSMSDATAREARARVSLPTPLPAHLAIDAQAAARPGAMAVSDGQGVLTYGQLVARANRIAHWLIREGVRPEARVGLAMMRSVDLIAAMLGILKAGAAYVPLDPAYPAERLHYMIEDAGVTHVLTQAVLAGEPWLPQQRGIVEAVLADETLPLTAPTVPVHAEQLAYVIYTSGSTGRPKGAQLTHRNLMRLLHATVDDFGFDTRDVWTMFHSYAFDFSVWEIFGALVNGARLVVVPHDTARDPAALWALVEREGVTVLNQTPSAFYQWLGAMPAHVTQTSLRHIVFGGEALAPARLAPWWQRFGTQARLTNMYGITETTVHVSQRALAAGDSAGSPIGEPIRDLEWRVLDAGLNPVPVGVAGDLYVCGAGLARGYLGRPGLTAERFVPDPWGAPGERMYRSGDRARRLADGTLDYLGRGDAQVKLRGFRIEPGEIEAQLMGHADVRDAAVMVRDDGAGEQLVGYVASPVDDADLWPRLRAHLGAQLPGYMVPGLWVRLDALPLTPNGKLDRRALPVPQAGVATTEYEAPHDGHEALVAEVWQQVLGVPQVSRHDDFFALGGHSLLATQVAARLRDRLGVEVPLRTLFEASGLTALATSLDDLAAAKPAADGATASPEADAVQDALRELESLSPQALQALLSAEAR